MLWDVSLNWPWSIQGFFGKTTICDSDHSQEAAEDKGYSGNENGLQANLWHPNSRGDISRRIYRCIEKCEKLGFI